MKGGRYMSTKHGAFDARKALPKMFTEQIRDSFWGADLAKAGECNLELLTEDLEHFFIVEISYHVVPIPPGTPINVKHYKPSKSS
jgi:hypothetical protein